MSQRLQIVLPDPVALQLHELAAGADTPPSTLASQLVRHGVAQAANDGKVRPLRQAPVITGSKSGERAPPRLWTTTTTLPLRSTPDRPSSRAAVRLLKPYSF
jgi:hypothetical protein